MGFNTANIDAVNKNTAMQAGEKVAAKLKNVELDQQGNLSFAFENEVGSLSHKEFVIDRTHQMWTEEKEVRSLTRIAHIVTAFVPKEQLDACNGETFNQWAMQIVNLLKPKVGSECVLKVIYTPKNYLGFPLFPNFISTEFRPTHWSTNPTYDKYVKTEVAADTMSDANEATPSTPSAEDEVSF